MREKREVSAGGIVYRRNQNIVEVALIRSGRRWGLPKGHLEPGESIQEAACREVAEETGLQGEVVDKLGEITYRFMNKWTEGKPVRVFKRVHFYLIRWSKGEVEGHDYEVDEARWVPLGEAFAMLSYATEKKMMQRAQAFIAAEAGESAAQSPAPEPV
jgi:8-oxo-dGTP pyrophosphatase MutT (NUDIX family)